MIAAKEFDSVRLKDGREGAIVDAKHAPDEYCFEWQTGEEEWDFAFITGDDIAEIIVL